MLKRFLAYYKPHKLLLTLDMLASFLVSLIAIFYPILTRKMLNDLIPNRNIRMIVIGGLSLLLLYFIRMLLNYFIQYQGHMMGIKMQAAMRSDMFKHLESLSYGFYDEHETGEIMARMTNDLFNVSELAHHGPETVIISSISVIISFVYLSTINIWLTLIIFACVPILVVVALKSRKKQRKAFKASRVSLAKINTALESSISGIRVTKAFTNAEEEQKKFEVGNEEFKFAKKDAYKALGEFHASTTFITDVFNVVVLLAGGVFMYKGKIDFADYSAFIVSINLFLSPITTLIKFVEDFMDGVTGFERFLEIMDKEPEKDAPDAVDIKRLEGNIDIKDVYYGYTGESDVLRGINLSIKAGQTYALVGSSGGGKTTLCHLIPHFYDISSGEIFMDGNNINTITMNSLRRNIGIVQQDVFLFNTSIRDNILYGRLDASDEEVIEAAKKANIHDFIMSLEQGYDTVIGERGVKLSGGQRQRLCIARVFLKNPPILILDEATSALDNVTEMMIQEALDSLSKGRTTLVVAHRLSTIKNADKIAVVNDGIIVEEGTHDELIAKNGEYADLYSRQFRDNKPERLHKHH